MSGLVYALVPARSGSKGLPNKNILPIDGHPLMAYSIAFGLALGVDRVIVSTDSEKYADIARHYGAECPYLRGAYASSETAMPDDYLADLTLNLPERGVPLPDIWLRVLPVYPFRRLDRAREAIRILEERPEIDSVAHVSRSETRLKIIGADGLLEPLPGLGREKGYVMRRDQVPVAYDGFSLDVFRHRNVAAPGLGYMGRRVLPIQSEAITHFNIDYDDDYQLVRALIESKPSADIVERHIVRPDVEPFGVRPGAAE